ncbi:MAG: DUF4235 domain-containing protein [Chitinivibrionales bacterium]|nr:DUF4235 domain-containing protein [Chitinivibrionales bacterium]
MKHKRRSLTEKLLWSATGTLVGVVAGAVSLRLAGAAWGLLGKGPPPSAPESRRTRWRDALLWSGLTGLAGGVVTVTLRRVVAEAWVRFRASGGKRWFG